MSTSREVIGRTPNGGVRMVMYYQDEKGWSVAERDATRVVIVEYDHDGKSLHRTYGTVKPKPSGTQRTTRRKP